MNWHDVPAFYASLDDGSATHLALRLLILTGVRSNPLHHIREDQIDDDISLWNLADTLTLTQAALLAVDLTPAMCMLDYFHSPAKANIKTEDGEFIPAIRFRAAYCAIIAAANVGKLKVTWCQDEKSGMVIDVVSTVSVDELKRWFKS